MGGQLRQQWSRHPSRWKALPDTDELWACFVHFARDFSFDSLTTLFGHYLVGRSASAAVSGQGHAAVSPVLLEETGLIESQPKKSEGLVTKSSPTAPTCAAARGGTFSPNGSLRKGERVQR